jgi:tetratricopeptide (TPR) repeat protein
VRTAAALVCAGALLAGCAPHATGGAHVEEDLATMKAERSVDKLVARGRAFASVGDFTRAEQYLSAAIDAGGDAGALLPELLRVCIASKRYRVAITYATPWLQRHPEDTRLRFVVAALRASIGDADGADRDFARILRDDPNDATVHFAYAVLLRDQLGDLRRADREFREYLRLDPRGAHVDEARASLLNSVP